MLEIRDRRLLFFVMFSAFASAWVLVKEPVEIYGGYLVIIPLLLVYTMRYGFPKHFWSFTAFFLFAGIIGMALGRNQADQFFKIFIGVMMSYLFYYYVLQRFDFDVYVIFQAYMKGAFVITVIGVVQFVSYHLHFQPGYDFRWLGFFNKWGVVSGGNLGIRINSVFGEPSTYAAVIAPAMFVALNNLITGATFMVSKAKSILIIVVYLLTFSSLGYMGIFVAIILLMTNYGFARFLFLFIPLIILAFFILYNYVPDFQYRFDSTVMLFETGNVDIRQEHGSSIVFYNNFVVAMENFSGNFLFGSGLGSHPVAFEKYSITKDVEVFGFANNSADANSMLLRIISEIGLTGIIFVFIFLKRGYVRRNKSEPENNYWIISSATLCLIALYLLRQGHYFLNGFPLFVWLYYFTRKNADWHMLRQTETADSAEQESTSNAERLSAE